MSDPVTKAESGEPRVDRSELNQRQERIIVLVRERGFVAIELWPIISTSRHRQFAAISISSAIWD